MVEPQPAMAAVDDQPAPGRECRDASSPRSASRHRSRKAARWFSRRRRDRSISARRVGRQAPARCPDSPQAWDCQVNPHVRPYGPIEHESSAGAKGGLTRSPSLDRARMPFASTRCTASATTSSCSTRATQRGRDRRRRARARSPTGATGIGCDQLILLEPSDVADVRMRIWNADGGEVEACGNATRCVAVLLGRQSHDRDDGRHRCSARPMATPPRSTWARRASAGTRSRSPMRWTRPRMPVGWEDLSEPVRGQCRQSARRLLRRRCRRGRRSTGSAR